MCAGAAHLDLHSDDHRAQLPVQLPEDQQLLHSQAAQPAGQRSEVTEGAWLCGSSWRTEVDSLTPGESRCRPGPPETSLVQDHAATSCPAELKVFTC